MKYLDLCALHEVNVALNFDTQDTAIIGGCDVWTVKAAGSDKKLYKRIEKTLEERHENLLATVARFSEQNAEQFADQLNIARETPFGTFNEASNRHTFAYLIATLNATHIDYDFANTLNPDEFRRETLDSFKEEITTTMFYLRPQIYSAGLPVGAMTPLGSPIWSPRSWQLINSEMDYANCEFYAWEPSDDPFADDGAIWSYHYFIYNKERKRVAYFYLRGVSALSNSPSVAMSLMSKFRQLQQADQTESSSNAGSRKRAEYWLGDRARKGLEAYGSSDELDNMVIDHPGEVVDAEENSYNPVRETSMDAEYYDSEHDSDVESLVEIERRKSGSRNVSQSGPRTVSQSIMDGIDI
ncbi:RNA polymerase III-inhibiting protein maf1 [Neocucurbitaria cava]|uniref:RNA polymerase III-inhibiting protein maf1 n=1 Tax=Neocucurbitaria cava TaxID=798079 RepID=A0A9W9CQE7_9PLEO|nr:RNA polymerase III-inhibiting protein maf1 [Neocucurbitaria cava]